MSDTAHNTEYMSQSVYRDTVSSVSEIVGKLDLYPEIMDALRNGQGTVEMRKRVMLRAIDEAWVTAIEDSLASLDIIIRNPSRFIEEQEKVLPIELTKTVSSRSIKHLSQHTDYISRMDGDDIVPSKLLNVFREETIQTYENKFINTLLNRLYAFVSVRYDKALQSGQDVVNTSVEVNNSFVHNDIHGKIQLRLEIEEPSKPDDVDKNYVFVSDLWRRVEKIRMICSDYMQSKFVQDMGKSYIRPPVMRTNAILKNKNMRQCLALWEFIEGYENAGYTTMVEESLIEADDSYIRELYSTLAMEYLMFRHHVDKGFDEDKELAKVSTESPLNPEIIADLSPASVSEFAIHVAAIESEESLYSVEEKQLLRILEVSLIADEVLTRRAFLKKLKNISYSFMAKLILAQDPAQTYYTDLKNHLLSFKGIRSRVSHKHENFNIGNNVVARITVKGKTLVLYLPLDPNDKKYSALNIINVSGHSSYKSLRLGIKIKSKKALLSAYKLIDEVASLLGAEQKNDYVGEDYHIPIQTKRQLIENGLIKIKGDYDDLKLDEEEIIDEEDISPGADNEESDDITDEVAEQSPETGLSEENESEQSEDAAVTEEVYVAEDSAEDENGSPDAEEILQEDTAEEPEIQAEPSEETYDTDQTATVNITADEISTDTEQAFDETDAQDESANVKEEDLSESVPVAGEATDQDMAEDIQKKNLFGKLFGRHKKH